MLKKVPSSSISDDNLTKKQAEVRRLFYNEFLTKKQISHRLQITIRSVNKLLKNIREKPLKDYEKKDQDKKGDWLGTREPFIYKGDHKIRLHRVELNVKILRSSPNYKVNVGSVLNIRGNCVRCFRDSLEIYIGRDFWGDNAQAAHSAFIEYYQAFILLLESDLRIKIVKDRSQNIRVVRSEYSEVNNELAKMCRDKREKLRFRGTDNKIWLEVDNSFNLNELEAKHPVTSYEDINAIKPFFDDLRNHPPEVNFSQLVTLFSLMAQEQKEISFNLKEAAAGLNAVVQLLRPSRPNNGASEANNEEDKRGPGYIG